MGKVSFTTDVWSDLDQKPYIVVTAHWFGLKGGQKKLSLRANLIDLMHIPGSHTGERLGQVFNFIISRIRLGKKVNLSLLQKCG